MLTKKDLIKAQKKADDAADRAWTHAWDKARDEANGAYELRHKATKARAKTNRATEEDASC